MQAYTIKRSRLQILTEILHFAKSPRAKTRLMQKANLSYYNLQDCLLQLQELDLIEFHPNTAEYATNEKGLNFLAKWSQLQELLTPKERVSIKAKKTSLKG